MALRSEIEQVTARISERSRTVRRTYRDRVTRAQEQGPHRATLVLRESGACHGGMPGA